MEMTSDFFPILLLRPARSARTDRRGDSHPNPFLLSWPFPPSSLSYTFILSLYFLPPFPPSHLFLSRQNSAVTLLARVVSCYDDAESAASAAATKTKRTSATKKELKWRALPCPFLSPHWPDRPGTGAWRSPTPRPLPPLWGRVCFSAFFFSLFFSTSLSFTFLSLARWGREGVSFHTIPLFFMRVC